MGIATGFVTNWFIKTDAGSTASVFSSYIQPKPSIKSGIPINLSIPSLDIELPVAVGVYNEDGSWTLNDTHAFYATPSSPVNDYAGTTLIYGHNIPQVFKNLPALQPGAELAILTDSGYMFRYEFSFITEVSPENTSVFAFSNAPNITLQTCSGPWDTLRSMYTFRLVEVIKI